MNTAFIRNRKRMAVRKFVAIAVFMGTSFPFIAVADSSPTGNVYERRAAAEALFDEAKSLMVAQRYSEACPKFAASQAMDPAVGTRLNLADCLEKLGKTASAWAEFRATAAAARAKGQTDRADIARRRAASLEHQLVRLSVVPPIEPHESLVIRTNGNVLEKGSWGVPLPVDPGRYIIVAFIDDKQAFRTDVDVPEKPGSVITATIPSMDDALESKRRLHRGLAIAAGTIGVVSITAGAFLGASAITRNTESSPHCNAHNFCDKAGVGLRNDAVVFGNGATSAFIIGSAAGIGAIVLHLTTPSKNPPTNIGFGAMQSGVGLIVGGSF